MPPIGTIEERVLCPLCSKEVSKGYLWYHKRNFCPMRPGRQEELKVLAMGTPVPKGSPQKKAAGASATGSSPPIQNKDQFSSNIISIDLTEEYKNMVKVMKKKKEEEEDNEFQCGACNALFKMDKAPKRCPECGVEF